MNIGVKISDLISKKKLTKIEVSKKLGIHRVTLDEYIKNKSPINIDILEKLAILTNTPITYFFDDTLPIPTGQCPNCERLERELELAYKYITTLEGQGSEKKCG